MKINTIKIAFTVLFTGCLVLSCDDFLDKQPPSYVVPSDYYKTEDQIQAVANQFYQDILPSHSGAGYGTFADDNGTDNQGGMDANTKYVKDRWKVGQDNGNWSWGNVRNINYQLNAIMTHYDAKTISGSDENIRHYIGEIHFFRAYNYFGLLRSFGDIPIVTEVYPDDEAILVAANKRRPRNEVARFIIADLDTAITYMQENFEPRHTRVSPDAARLLQSRVALFEGSWLTNFKGTPFVPGGQDWPGAQKDYNSKFNYIAGDIDQEAKYFFQVAAESAETVADKYIGRLSVNNGVVPQSTSDSNPYFYMFGNTDLSGYPEVLLWKEYNKSLGVTNNVEVAIQHGNTYSGVTRGMIDAFLMADGKPAYASQYNFCDTSVNVVTHNRDPRLAIFMKRPGQKNIFKNMDSPYNDNVIPVEPLPVITTRAFDRGYSTGYTIRKGGTFDKALCQNQYGYTASITFRATEALLNYMEAEYMLTKNLSAGKIISYWKEVRKAAGFTGEGADPEQTVQATDMSKETAGLVSGTAYDWGAFTAGKALDDKILYSIRRERRCELMAESLRWMDLIRWRSLDQLIEHPYHIEGIHIWNTPMENWYWTKDDKGNSINLLVDDGSKNATVSSRTLSEYTRPYEIVKENNSFYNGFTWAMAQYLQPLPIKQFLLTASDHASIELSPLYQNPYWPTTPDMPAEK